jgi:xanthine/CO dehydrogenase XdhC/CoxF family maturation factor
MKMWNESSEILDRLQSLCDGGDRAAIAVLLQIEGSSYRRPGAKMLVSSDGSRWGSLSGGCLEEDVRQIALAVMNEGTPRQLRYETGSDDETVWGLGLGCEGVVDIYVQPASVAAYLTTLAAQRRLLQGEEPFSVATLIATPEMAGAEGRRLIIASGEVVAGSTGDSELDTGVARLTASASEGAGNQLHTVGAATLFVESYVPPPNLLIVGAGDDAVPLARLAAEVGFRVFVVDHRSAYLTGERFPEAWRLIHASAAEGSFDLPSSPKTYAVVKTHSLNRDKDWLRTLLSAPLPYVGLLGPRNRREEILSELAEEERQRVYGPVGLDLGAEGPEQVAISIVAELLAVVSCRCGGHLRDLERPIHAAPPARR